MNYPSALFTPAFAHRGLWRPEGPAENSLAAIAAAMDDGYGAEFDVRLTADEAVVVFHDETLERMTGLQARLDDLALDDLAPLRLTGGLDPVSTLAQVLEVAAGRQMLLVELKATGDPALLAARTAAVLDHYRGPCAVISFEALALDWFADNRPEVWRGLDASGASDDEMAQADADLEHLFEGRFDLARPHFLVLEKTMVGGHIATRFRSRGHPVIAWTIRDSEEIGPISEHCDNIIFEGFTA